MVIYVCDITYGVIGRVSGVQSLYGLNGLLWVCRIGLSIKIRQEFTNNAQTSFNGSKQAFMYNILCEIPF